MITSDRRTTLVGRTEECARVDRLLAEARTGSSAVLVVGGEPGIGKTALLEHARARARAAGMTVIAARGVESEAQVPFAGLLELLRPALGALELLPEPQADALRGALALGPARETDRFAIGAATLSLLAAEAELGPLLVVVDDAHWLDESSIAAILFAARRLLVDPIAVLLAARSGEAPAIEAAGLPQVDLAGLDPGPAAEIVGRHAPGRLAPGTTERVLSVAAGNPLALVELAAGGADLDDEPGDAPPSVQTSLELSYRRRIDALDDEERAVLMLAAADEWGELPVIDAAAAALDLDLRALEAAERAGLISIGPGRVEFRHPLTRAAAYHACSPGRRRAAHGALAGALEHESQADRRAGHLAAAALGPDEAAASALEAAAGRARGRSAYAAAAGAAERAARLTPAGELRGARIFMAAEAAWLSGDVERTIRALDEALSLSSDLRLRAEVQRLRGEVAMRAGFVVEAYEILVAGADEVEDEDPSRAVVMYAEAAEACGYAGRPEAMLATARRAWDLLSPQAGGLEAFCANLALGTALVFNGRGGEGAPLLRGAVAVLEGSEALARDPRVLSDAAIGPLYLREAATGRGLIDRAIESARAQSALGELPFALVLAARGAATGDRWGLGDSLYDEAIRLARETGQALALCGALAGLACIDARRGREEACRRHAGEARAMAGERGLVLHDMWALEALADLELGLGRPDDAIAPLTEKIVLLDGLGIRDPDVSPMPELVEAHVRMGRDLDDPGRLEDFLRLAEEKGQPWVLARAWRCRALRAGDDELERAFSVALEHHARTPDRFDEARTRLCYGERLRRARRRSQARPQLRTALDAFEELGADPWADRARAELAATGETARRRDASTADRLTPQELQIAMTLAEGHTTREAATKLFLSPKTVEYHLRNVYRKLGVRSRDALAAALRGPGPLNRRAEGGDNLREGP